MGIISKYRTQIMGIAIIWVMLYHTYNDYGIGIINRLTNIGYGGVDLFFFLSGYGLYFSSKKQYSTLHFYKRRFIRIIPTYLFVLLIINIIKRASLLNYITTISSIGFWLPFTHLPYYAWFIPSIMMLYLIFPFYIKGFNKRPKTITSISILIGILLSLVYTYYFCVIYIHDKNQLIFLTSRLPTFVIGIYFGMLSYNKVLISQKCKCIITALFLIGVFLLFYFTHIFDYWVLRNGGLEFYPFILITPFLCIILSYIFKHMPILINRIFIFIGKMTLEIYLIHEFIFQYHIQFMKLIKCSATLSYISLILLSVIIAYLLFIIKESIYRMLSRKTL